MEIGRFYQVKKKYVAALNRFKEVVNEFDDTNQIEEALFRLVETNLALGFGGEANKYASILGHNYQNGRWYKKAYSLLNTGVNGDSSKSFFGDLFKFGDEEEGDITTIEPLHSSEADSKLEKLYVKWQKLLEPEYHDNGRKKRITKDRIKKIKNSETLYWREHYKCFPKDKPKVKTKRRKRNS